MELEDRYIVLKRKDLKGLRGALVKTLTAICGFHDVKRQKRGVEPLQCLVIEKDWPEYEIVLKMLSERVDGAIATPVKHSHYKKDVSHLKTIDIYRILELFENVPHAIGHAIKKLLVPGIRGGGKDVEQDYREAIDSIQRELQMRSEDCNKR